MTFGGPKDLATTASNAPRNSGALRQNLRPTAENRNPRLPSDFLDITLKQPTAALGNVEKSNGNIRPQVGKNEPWNTAPGAQVEHPASSRLAPPETLQEPRKTKGVPQVQVK